jgi:hypothetical protein
MIEGYAGHRFSPFSNGYFGDRNLLGAGQRLVSLAG